jgi:hypothetical protein
MKKLSPPIAQATQLQPFDLIFSVTTEEGILNKLKKWYHIQRLRKQFPDVESTLLEFNSVRLFWGFALSNYAMMCVEWDKLQKPRVTFVTEWIMTVDNAWIFRHNKVITRGIDNKEAYENAIGLYYMNPPTGNQLLDINTLYQQAKISLGKEAPKSIPELMLNSNLILINSKNDIDR